MKFKLELTFELPEVDEMDDEDAADLFEFIEDALGSWGGQRHPDDWLFNSLENVELVSMREMYVRRRPRKVWKKERADEKDHDSTRR